MRVWRLVWVTGRRRSDTVAWALYDLADTVFSGALLTFYFPLWLAFEVLSNAGPEGRSDIFLAFAISGSMLAVMIAAPIIGSLSDRLHRRVPLLAFCVFISAVAVMGIGQIGGISTGIALFMIANFMYQISVVFHNSLIVNVTTMSERGIVSGIGVGFGFAALALLFTALDPVVTRFGDQAAFIPIAIAFIVLAIPLLWLVKERGARHPLNKDLFIESYLVLYETFHRARRHVNLFRFIISRFLYTEAISTFALFLILYLLEIGQVPEAEARAMVIGSVIVATFAAWIGGYVESRFGPKNLLVASTIGWIAVIVLAAFASETWMYWVVVMSSGVLWATTQVSERVVLTELTPSGQIGEFFGLFQVSGRRAAFIGPIVWGVSAWALQGSLITADRVALGFIIVLLVVALVLLWRVREIRERPDLIHMETHGGHVMLSSE